MPADCSFCPESVLPGRIDESRIVRKEGRISVVPNYGSLATPGYVLLVPERHVVNFKELPREEYESYLSATSYVDSIVGPDSIHFQHIGTGYGKTINHAHEHVVPGIPFGEFRDKTRALLDSLAPETGLSYKYFEHKRDKELSLQKMSVGIPSPDKGALYFYGEGRQGIFLLEGEPNPKYSAILRKVSAEILGVPELADWKVVRSTEGLRRADDEIMRETARMFGKELG